MVEKKTSESASAMDAVICGLCGHQNPVTQRFCGQCGGELKSFFRRVKEEQRAFDEGPQTQVTFLFGVFGETGSDGIEEEAIIEQLRKRLLGRFRLVVTERGGKFEDLGKGRFGATMGHTEPTEEDPLDAVTLGLKLLRLAAVGRQLPPLRLVATTGRIPQRMLQKPLFSTPEREDETEGHALYRLAQKVSRPCPVGGLFVDSLTYRMIRDTHHCKRTRLGGGVLASTPIYEVQSSVDSTRGAFSLPMMGREREMGRLMRALERIESGEGPIFFTLTGELGIGKTRLLMEFQRSISGRAMLFRNPRERRRIDRWRRTPYSYFAEILRAFFEIYENEEDELSRQKLVQGILSTYADRTDQAVREIAHLIGLLCQVDFPESPYIDTEREDPTQLERRAFAAFTRYLEGAATRRPLVFLLDNLYSADSSSLRLLKHLTQSLESSPILFVCASRHALLTKLEEEAEMTLPGERLHLKPLSEETAKQLVQAILPEQIELPVEIMARILAMGEGNPFFLRECLRDLSEQGLAELSKEGRLEQLEIPQSLEGILQARLSRLGSEEREILQKAAIFGRAFWRGGVEMLLRYEADIPTGWRITQGVTTSREDDVEEILQRLEEQGVIQIAHESFFEGEPQYLFSPSLLQELMYQEIPTDLLPHYHRLAAQWLELVARHRILDLSTEIAHHLELGELPARAATYQLDLGQQALKASSVDAAIVYLEKGLKGLDGTMISRRVEGLRLLSEAYLQQGRYPDAMRSFEQLLGLSWQMGHRVLAGEIFSRMGWVAFLMRDFEKALSLLKNAHALHQESEYTRGVAMALSHMGKVYTVLGDYNQARVYLQEALDLRRQLGHAGDLAWTLNDMGNLQMEQGLLAQARSSYEEALAIRRQIGHTSQILQSMNNLALLHVSRGDYDAALAELQEILALAQKASDKLALAVVLVNIAESSLLQGDLARCMETLDRAMATAEKLGDKWILAECYRIQGECLLEQGEPLEALVSCGKAYRLVMEKNIRSLLSSLYRLMGQVYAAIPAETLESKAKSTNERLGLPPFLFGKAAACFDEAIAMAQHHGNLREEAKSRLEMGVFETNSGKIQLGRDEITKAKGMFSRLGMDFYVELAERLLDDIQEFQEAEEDEESKPYRENLAAQTIQFRVTFSEEDIGPAPSTEALSKEEREALLQGDAKQDDALDLAAAWADREASPVSASSASVPQEASSTSTRDDLLAAPKMTHAEERTTSEMPIPPAAETPVHATSEMPVHAATLADLSTVAEMPIPLANHTPSSDEASSQGGGQTRVTPVYVMEALAQASIREEASETASLVEAFSEADHDDEWTDQKTVRIKGFDPSMLEGKSQTLALPVSAKPPILREEDTPPTLEATDGDLDAIKTPMQTERSSTLAKQAQATSDTFAKVALPPPALPPPALPPKPTTSKTPSTSLETSRPSRTHLPFPKLTSSGLPALGAVSSPALSIPEMPGIPPAMLEGAWKEENAQASKSDDAFAAAPRPSSLSIPEMPGIQALEGIEFPGKPDAKELPGTISRDDLPAFAPESKAASSRASTKLPFPKLGASPLSPPLSAVSTPSPSKKPEKQFSELGDEKVESFPVEEDPAWRATSLQETKAPQARVHVPPPPPEALRASRQSKQPTPPAQPALVETAAPTPPSGVPPHASPTPPSGSTKPAIESIESAEEEGFSSNPQAALQAALSQKLAFEEGGEASVDPALFPKMPPKKPSVYDSQMIIAQVAEDDHLSRDWFEEGRSDRSKKFWKEHQEDLKEVHEELQHEQILEELEKMPEKKKS